MKGLEGGRMVETASRRQVGGMHHHCVKCLDSGISDKLMRQW